MANISLRDRAKAVLRIAAELDPRTDPLIDPDLNPSWHYRHSPEAIWLMSLANHEKNSFGGKVTEANPFVAAECIYEGTHRVAEPHEVEAEQRRREDARKQILETEAASKNSMTSHQLIETVVGAVTAAQAQNLSQAQLIEAITAAVQAAQGKAKPERVAAGKDKD